MEIVKSEGPITISSVDYYAEWLEGSDTSGPPSIIWRVKVGDSIEHTIESTARSYWANLPMLPSTTDVIWQPPLGEPCPWAGINDEEIVWLASILRIYPTDLPLDGVKYGHHIVVVERAGRFYWISKREWKNDILQTIKARYAAPFLSDPIRGPKAFRLAKQAINQLIDFYMNVAISSWLLSGYYTIPDADIVYGLKEYLLTKDKRLAPVITLVRDNLQNRSVQELVSQALATACNEGHLSEIGPLDNRFDLLLPNKMRAR